MFWTIVGALLFVFVGIPLILNALGIIGSVGVAVADAVLSPSPVETEEERLEREERERLEEEERKLKEEESRRKQTPWAWAILIAFLFFGLVLPLLLALLSD